MDIDVNLNEVKEKPLLPADVELGFAIVTAEVKIAKNANKSTGNKEPYVNCTMTVLNPEWPDYKVFHSFSLSIGALSSPDATFSIKKFFSVVGYVWRTDGKFSTEEVQTIRFMGKLKYEDKAPNRPVLAAVLRGIKAA